VVSGKSSVRVAVVSSGGSIAAIKPSWMAIVPGASRLDRGQTIRPERINRSKADIVFTVGH
jgi:hypothetical protein